MFFQFLSLKIQMFLSKVRELGYINPKELKYSKNKAEKSKILKVEYEFLERKILEENCWEQLFLKPARTRLLLYMIKNDNNLVKWPKHLRLLLGVVSHFNIKKYDS